MFEKLEELAKNNKKISDFHIRTGWPLAYRQTGEIHKVPEVMVKAQDLQDLISTNCNEVEMKRFNETHELDSSVTLSGLRFRANFYKTINVQQYLEELKVSYQKWDNSIYHQFFMTLLICTKDLCWLQDQQDQENQLRLLQL